MKTKIQIERVISYNFGEINKEYCKPNPDYKKIMRHETLIEALTWVLRKGD